MSNGIIEVVGSFDFEIIFSYFLILIVIDLGFLIDMIVVVILVRDVNESFLFVGVLYFFIVLENDVVVSVVIVVVIVLDLGRFNDENFCVYSSYSVVC